MEIMMLNRAAILLGISLIGEWNNEGYELYHIVWKFLGLNGAGSQQDRNRSIVSNKGFIHKYSKK